MALERTIILEPGRARESSLKQRTRQAGISQDMRIAIFLFLGTMVAGAFERIQYNHPGLTSDLGVGLWSWPMPMDWDQDGDLDLIVSCPDKPFNGTYFFENTGNDSKMPLFEPPKRLGGAISNTQVSYVDGMPRLLTLFPFKATQNGGKKYGPREILDFGGGDFSKYHDLPTQPIHVGDGNVRAKQWKFVDFDGDGILDLSYGAGFWGDYGWDNAYNDKGEWQNGPLRGYVYILRNKGSNEKPKYEKPRKLQAGGKDVDLYGMPTPNFADFDGDGDLDLLCGEFLDGFSYFKNIGTRRKPVYTPPVYLTKDGQKITMHVQMIVPVVIDWDKDGDPDIICGDEDGRVAFVENTGTFDANETPQFEEPRYFQQKSQDLKFGALATPLSVDWDDDGDEDLICGNTSGNIAFIENLDGKNPPKWAVPKILKAGGKTIHIQAGLNGSIQGPAERKWGYTVLNVCDWDHDGELDIIFNDIHGTIRWFKNSGEQLEEARQVKVRWNGNPPKPEWNWRTPKKEELSTQWRTTPMTVDWNKDGLNDLIMLDHEGYLAFFERKKEGGELFLLPGNRIFKSGRSGNKNPTAPANEAKQGGGLLRLNDGIGGRSGRRKLTLTDWDGDGDLDLLANTKNVALLENTGTKDGFTTFENRGDLHHRALAGHTTCPTVVDWDKNGVPDLLAGAEDGRFYFLENRRKAENQ